VRVGKINVSICMPAFNEANAIERFLDDIFDRFSDTNLVGVVVVNDCSSDNTAKVLNRIAEMNSTLSVIHNAKNLGHGPSTLVGLQTALSQDADYILSCDGDGHISGQDLRHLLTMLIHGKFDLVEGVRHRPKDKWFRKIVSSATRFLVWQASGIAPQDANTPFRAYKNHSLSKLMDNIPMDSMVPNLLISQKSRRAGLKIHQEVVYQITREGAIESGSTWNQRFSFLPSRRFIAFCLKAVKQWSFRVK
jgi:glycosyltransferase involved in cell wall biosynthesis